MAITVDEVLADLKVAHGVDIQAALDFVAAGEGTATYVVGINRASKAETEAQERDAALQKDALYATIKDLTAKVAALEAEKEAVIK